MVLESQGWGSGSRIGCYLRRNVPSDPSQNPFSYSSGPSWHETLQSYGAHLAIPKATLGVTLVATLLLRV